MGCRMDLQSPTSAVSARRLVGRSARSIQVRRPIVYQPLPTLEQVGTGVGGLDLVLDHMRQRRLDDLPRVVRLLCRPPMTSRWTQLRVPVGWTNRYKPFPSAWRPGGAERTKAAESALSGWRPRRLVRRVVVAVLATIAIPPLHARLSRISQYALNQPAHDDES